MHTNNLIVTRHAGLFFLPQQRWPGQNVWQITQKNVGQLHVKKEEKPTYSLCFLYAKEDDSGAIMTME